MKSCYKTFLNYDFISLPMDTKTILGASFAAIFAVSMIMTPAFASGHLSLVSASAVITGDRLKADLVTSTAVPLDGSAGAFGYAILTNGGSGALDNVVVLVTHLGIDDSSHEDPISGFHTHVLDLMAPSKNCKKFDVEVDLAGSVANAAFDSNYQWIIDGTSIKIRNVPTSDLGNPTEVLGVVAFTVTPVFKGGSLTNLCVDVI